MPPLCIGQPSQRFLHKSLGTLAVAAAVGGCVVELIGRQVLREPRGNRDREGRAFDSDRLSAWILP